MRRRIAFVINSLAGGGAERVFCEVIAGLAAELRDWETRVVLLDDEPCAYEPPPFATRQVLDARGGMTKSVQGLVKALHPYRPDISVSFLSRANCAAAIAASWYGFPAVLSERVATAAHFGEGPSAALKRAATRMLYARARAIIAVSEGVRRGLIDDLGLAPGKIEVIANPVSVASIRMSGRQAPEIALPQRFIAAAGRLTPNKNFALLLDAFAASAAPHALVLMGEGPERAALEARARALGVAERVHFIGFLANPFAVMARAELFVSTSNAEGFPNAMAEAMALGIPVAATNCPSGPAEILADNVDVDIQGMHCARYGVLTPVGQVAPMAQAIRFLSAPKIRAHYAVRARERALMYQPEAIVAQYWRVISGALARLPRGIGARGRPAPAQ